MGLYDWISNLFAPGERDPFEDRLRSFVRKERDSRTGEGSGERKLSAREKMEAARHAVDAIARRFGEYVVKNVVSRHRDQFRFEQPTPSQTSRIHDHFGENPSGNEARIVRVAFQDRCSLYVKVQAIILSQSLEIKAVFVDHEGKVAPHRAEIPLHGYDDIAEVPWDRLFETLVTEFLDWRENPPPPEE